MYYADRHSAQGLCTSPRRSRRGGQGSRWSRYVSDLSLSLITYVMLSSALCVAQETPLKTEIKQTAQGSTAAQVSGQAEVTSQERSESAERPTDRAKVKRPPIKRLDRNRLMVGDVLVDRDQQQIEIPAEVNLTRGILEYYGVMPDGKTHESVLKVLATPSHIHLALILAGYEPSQYKKLKPKEFKRTLVKRGDLLRLYLKWRPAGLDRDQWIPASAWLYERKTESPPNPQSYTFEGSFIDSNGYVADRELSVIGLIDDPTVVLAPTVDPGNPYQGDRVGFEVYSSAIPPKGTPVTIVVRGAGKKELIEIARYEEELAEIAAVRRRRLEAEDKLRPLPPPPPFEVLLQIDARSDLGYHETE